MVGGAVTQAPLFVAEGRLDALGGRLAICRSAAIPVPILAQPAAILMEPGSSTSHRGISLAAELGIPVIWCERGGIRYLAHSAHDDATRVCRQAALISNPKWLRQAGHRLFNWRFPERRLHPRHGLNVIRGAEGTRVRALYKEQASTHGVSWSGRVTKGDWNELDAINKTLSMAHACLYGLAHCAIVAAGYSPALGILHGQTRSDRALVFDLADLFKARETIPLAFKLVADGRPAPEWAARAACANAFRDGRLFMEMMSAVRSIFEE